MEEVSLELFGVSLLVCLTILFHAIGFQFKFTLDHHIVLLAHLLVDFSEGLAISFSLARLLIQTL